MPRLHPQSARYARAPSAVGAACSLPPRGRPGVLAFTPGRPDMPELNPRLADLAWKISAMRKSGCRICTPSFRLAPKFHLCTTAALCTAMRARGVVRVRCGPPPGHNAVITGLVVLFVHGGAQKFPRSPESPHYLLVTPGSGCGSRSAWPQHAAPVQKDAAIPDISRNIRNCFVW